MMRWQEDIVWQSGKFRVDEQGRVWRGSKRAEKPTPQGYLQVRVMINGRRYCTGAHRLVWHALKGPIPKGLTINHDNGRKGDNTPSNLELATHSEQMIHDHRKLHPGKQKGSQNNQAKLSEQDIEAIRKAVEAGEHRDAVAQRFGISFQAVSKIVRGDRWQDALGPTNRIDGRTHCAHPPRVMTEEKRRIIQEGAASGLSWTDIAALSGVSKTTVARVLRRHRLGGPRPKSGGRMLDGREWNDYPSQPSNQKGA